MPSTTMPMLETYPKSINLDRAKLAAVVEALNTCAQACTACADACLSEDMVAELTKCVRTNLDCADICTTTARVLSRHTGYDANITRALLEACATACKSCGDECAGHAGMHEHCRICAEACRACERACRDLLATMS
ncbi:four-helix bundle copper-binding protein [Micromonospora sp. NPDC049060]|uniref:four-helix bundle copper-binding protein n=1 Tax=unclassified Micromonospora TaxID=2617518 RepID=UPI0033DF164D